MPLLPNSLEARDVASVLHPYTNMASFPQAGPFLIDRGEGVYVFDREGNGYIEGMAGLWCTSLGFNEKELIEAATAQLHKLPFYHVFGGKGHEGAIELAEKLKAMMPFKAGKVSFCGSGSEANDTQLKLVWYYNNITGRPKKKKVISRIKAYHGVTVATASLTGLPHLHADWDLPIANILHTDCPHYYRFANDGESEAEFSTRLAKNLDEMIQREGPDTIAAFIAEPIMGAAGVLVPPADYFEKIQSVLDKYDILFIDDEVITGFGRTGNMFGAETFGLRPTSMSLAKALSSAYVPIGAVILPEFMDAAIAEGSRRNGNFGHGFTYTGHPLGCAVALKTLELYERMDIVGRVRRVMPLFQKRLKNLAAHPLVGETRGVGLIGALELVADKPTKRAFKPAQGIGLMGQKWAQANGLIVRAIGDTLALCPPLIITEEEIDLMFDRLERGLNETDGQVTREGLRSA
ncbi:MAG: 4-aminobutyrate---pyruvate transaminase [Alphaproteobacteria bacterium]|nr:4-aminobutyrate---pyruvate transaminase [Alphaproteobacteria bacterium]